MGLFSKEPFKWREPREFRRALDAMRNLDARWWHRPITGLALSGILLASWAFARLIPNRQPPPPEVAIPLACIAGPFLVYFLSWLSGLAPRNVIIREDRLILVVAEMNRVNRYELRFPDIEEFDLRDCGPFGVLVLSPKRGGPALIGVPPDVDRSALDQYLRDRGLVRTVTTDERRSSGVAAWEAFESFLRVFPL